MHLYTLSRGIKEAVDIAIRDLQAKYYLMNNEGEKIATQFQVRPIQLWEFVFAEDQLNTVLATINYRENWEDARLTNKFAMLRKMLKLKKIPEIDYKKALAWPINNQNVGWHHIGIKEDGFNENGTELL